MENDKSKVKKKKCSDCKKMFNAKMEILPKNLGGVRWESQCRKCHIEFNKFMLSGLFKKTN